VKSDGNFPSQQNTSSMMMTSMGKSLTPENNYANKNGEEEIEDWNCHEDCPIKILDEQSGISIGKIGMTQQSSGNNKIYGKFEFNGNSKIQDGISDKGGASRFFYVAKASKSERNKGLEGFEEKEKPENYIMKKLTCSECGRKSVDSSNTLVCGCNGKTHYEEQNSTESKNNLAGGNKNFHPTVKPIKLMQYLVRLVTAPNGIVLDPFCGSGTTGIACKLERFEFVGMEQDPEYCKIAQARIDNYVEEKVKKSSKSKKDNNLQPTLF
jgi:site-specific DNA-methyltransferase (adenine-specific)